MNLARKWLAIALASLVMSTSYWLVVYGRVAGDIEDGPSSTSAFALGLALVPFAFMALAFLTKHDDAAWAVLKAMGVFLVVGLPIGFFDVVIGVVAGYAAGAIVAVGIVEGVHRLRPRLMAALAAVAYTTLMLFIVPPLGVFTGSVVSFAAIGVADQIVEGRLADSIARREAVAGRDEAAD